MPKHKHHDRPVEKKINIKQSIITAVDIELRDKYTGKPIFGAWSALVTKLLQDWLRTKSVRIDLESKERPF